MSRLVDIEECDWCGEERPVAEWYEDGNAPICAECLAAVAGHPAGKEVGA